MKLAAYLAREGLTNAAFARQTGLSEGTVSLLSRDEIWLSRVTASKIFEATNGEVTPNDFLSAEAAE
jgi:3,4-dihydroxy 2-butanone 4-phosphate synthase / GTP cyclohydrolase II